LLQKEGFWSDKIASSLLQEGEVAEKSKNRNFFKGFKATKSLHLFISQGKYVALVSL
jgi:hypothetical protein